MMTEILGFVRGIFQPAADLVDNIHTSDEERLTIKAKLLEIESQVSARFVDYAQKLAELQAKIITTETEHGNWLTKSWRPLVMLNFLLLINLYWFGIVPPGMTEATIQSLLEIIKWGLGGYVVGRSVEKTATTVMKTLKKDKSS